MYDGSRDIDDDEDLNIGHPLADLMSNAFMILSFFLLITIIQLGLENAKVKSDNANLIKQIERLKAPPLIVIRDSPNRRFRSGSAVLSEGLRKYIEGDIVKEIKGYANSYQGYVIEVIGHTDGDSNENAPSNLDETLEQVTAGKKSIRALKAGSNADLGLMRALSVVKKLESNQDLKPLGLKFRAYSAAQLYCPSSAAKSYCPSGGYAPMNRNSDQSRRRIEIRFVPPALER